MVLRRRICHFSTSFGGVASHAAHPLVSTLGAFNVTSFPFADFLDPIVSAGTSLSISSRRPGLQGHLPQLHSGEGWPCVDIDRKSTRLNSSHQIISYAVF